MEKKKCTKCGKVKSVNEFNKRKKSKDGLRHECNQCRRQYQIDNREQISEYRKIYRENNKEIIAIKKKQRYQLNKATLLKKCKQYYQDNKEKISERCKLYYNTNRETIIETVKQYVAENKEKISEHGKQYRLKNKGNISEQKRQHYRSNAIYKFFFNKLTVDELPILSDDCISLEVKCRYCGKYFIPSFGSANNRVRALNGELHGENYLYCSEDCKQVCPVYGQVKYPKGFKQITENSGHEGDEIWKQEVIKRNIEEYGQLQCEICGNTNENELSTHHEKPRKTHPEMSLDPDNGWVLCSFGKGNNCHLKYGHPKGTNCSTAELAKLVCSKKQKNVV